ncbi:MAG: hypothetical protein ACE5GS_17595 [Kiloniellaceae bacterium]
MLDGYKSYIVALAMVVLSLIDIALVDVPSWDGPEMLTIALGMAGLRRGMKTGA